MKLLLILFLSLFSFFSISTSKNVIFTEDVFVKNKEGTPQNLKEMTISQDTVIVIPWAKWCGSCIKKLDNMNINKLYANYKIIAVAICKGDSMEKEKSIVINHKWAFDVFFDNNQNVANYFYKQGYYQKNVNEPIGFYGFPQLFVFAGDKLLCYNCEKYLTLVSGK